MNRPTYNRAPIAIYQGEVFTARLRPARRAKGRALAAYGFPVGTRTEDGEEREYWIMRAYVGRNLHLPNSVEVSIPVSDRPKARSGALLTVRMERRIRSDVRA